MTYSVYDLLRSLVEHGASDLHLKAGAPPGFRKDGQIQPQHEFGVLDARMTATLVRELMNDDRIKAAYLGGDL